MVGVIKKNCSTSATRFCYFGCLLTPRSFFVSFVLTVYMMNFHFVKVQTINGVSEMMIDANLDCDGGKLLTRSVCIPKGYRKGEVPHRPTLVRTKIEINHIRDIDDKKMRITLDFYQALYWVDNRIKTNYTDKSNAFEVLNTDLVEHIWKPDLWIRNLYYFELHKILVPTSGLIVLSNDFCKNMFPPQFCSGFFEQGIQKEDATLDLDNYNATASYGEQTMHNRTDYEHSTTNNATYNNTTDPSSAKIAKEDNTIISYNYEAQATLYCNFHFLMYPLDTQQCVFES